jgi:hypothetical protein
MTVILVVVASSAFGTKWRDIEASSLLTSSIWDLEAVDAYLCEDSFALQVHEYRNFSVECNIP